MRRLQDIIPIVVLILSFIYVFKTITVPVELRKVFHHTGDTSALNVGKLIIYFDNAPQVKVKKIKRTEFIYEYVFEFENTHIVSQETQESINALEKGRYAYDVKIESGERGEKPLVSVSFTFDERDIGFTSQEFIAITGEHAIAFNFYSKVVLQHIEKKESVPVLQTTWNSVPTVCIDCGHGGKDSGAIGLQGTMEKNVCLALGTQVGDELKKNGIPVIFTRDSDVFVPLEDRTRYAYEKNADLFVSIHANASTNKAACGIETYCCNPFFLHTKLATFGDVMTQQIVQLEEFRFKKSLALANKVHVAVCHTSKTYNASFKDRHIKHGAAQVLFATHIPALLIEVGFVSHPQEEQLLASSEYQMYLGQSIASGIVRWINA